MRSLSVFLPAALAATLAAAPAAETVPDDKLPAWAELVPLTGDEAAPIVNDCVDLTPLVREDILLEFPQHPLCDRDCAGIPDAAKGQPTKHRGTGQPAAGSSAWAELNKLKL